MMGFMIVTILSTGQQAFIGDGHIVKLPPISWRCDVCKANEHPENGAFRKVGHPFEYWACIRCLEAGKEPC